MKHARPWIPWALAGLGYLLGSVLFAWPMPAHLGDAVWGDRFDAWTTMWLIWQLGDGLQGGGLEAVTTRIFYPEGYNLWSFGHLGVQLLGAPFVALGASPVSVYNGLLLAAFTGTGLAAHALGRALSGSHGGGLLAGALFAWNPYTYGEMSAGCVELVAAFMIPLYALALLRVCERPTVKRGLVAAAVLALTGPLNWYYTAFLAIFSVVFWGWRALAGGPRRPRVLAVLIGAAVLAACANAPLIPKVRQETPERHPISAQTFAEENWALSKRIADGRVPLEELDAGLLVTNDAMQVAINSTSLINLVEADFPTNPLESTPGRLAYALGLFGLLAAGRRGRPWALMAGGFTLLTLGPYLQLDATPPLPAWSLADPLPYKALYNELPFFSKAYRPYRLGVLALLCLSALAAVGYASFRARFRWALPAGVALLAASQPLWSGAAGSRELADARIPEVYAELAALPDGAVIELPLHYQPVTPANARFQFNQVLHRKPLLNCNQLIRRTDLARFRDYVGANSVLGTLLDLGRREAPYRWRGEDLQALYDQGFRYVLAHASVPEDQAALAGFVAVADRLRQPAWQMLDESLGAPVLEGEEGTRVYALPERSAPGERSWDGATWEERSLPWQELELPVTLLPGDEGLLLSEEAAALSLWLLRPEEGAGEGVLVVDSGGVTQELPTQVGAWVWTHLELPGGALRLRASGGSVVLRVDAVQVRR